MAEPSIRPTVGLIHALLWRRFLQFLLKSITFPPLPQDLSLGVYFRQGSSLNYLEFATLNSFCTVSNGCLFSQLSPDLPNSKQYWGTPRKAPKVQLVWVFSFCCLGGGWQNSPFVLLKSPTPVPQHVTSVFKGPWRLSAFVKKHPPTFNTPTLNSTTHVHFKPILHSSETTS